MWSRLKLMEEPRRRWRVFEGDDDAERARAERKKSFLAYPGCTGTLCAWIRLILLLPRLPSN